MLKFRSEKIPGGLTSLFLCLVVENAKRQLKVISFLFLAVGRVLVYYMLNTFTVESLSC